MSKYEGKYNLISKTEFLLFDILLEIEKIADNNIELSKGEIESINNTIKPTKTNKPTLKVVFFSLCIFPS